MIRNFLLVCSLLLFSGCAGNFGPALTRTATYNGAVVAMLRSPGIVPEVKVAAELVCSEANGQNPTPANIANALSLQAPQNKEALVLLQGALDIYSLAVNSLGTTNRAKIQPYAKAMCEGLNNALGVVGAPTTRTRNSIPKRVVLNDPNWPVIKD